jgi:hypothetical protein
MRAKVLQFLAVCILAVGFFASPTLGRGGYSLDDCNGSGSQSCGGG